MIYSTISEIPGSLEWNENSNQYSNVQHKGQMKLLISECQFFTLIPKDQYCVVYPGSGKGFHIPLLIKYLPFGHWFLYDPQGFCNSLNDFPNVHLYSDYFYPEKCKEHINQYLNFNKTKLLLISDIRESPETENIMSDHKLHDEWIKSLKPEYCWLKWRLPYGQRPELSYFQTNKGYKNIFLQVFTKKFSGECRMFIEKNQYSKTILTFNEQKEIEDKLFYYNSIIRSLQYDLQVAKQTFKSFNEKFKSNFSFSSTMKSIVKEIQISEEH